MAVTPPIDVNMFAASSINLIYYFFRKKTKEKWKFNKMLKPSTMKLERSFKATNNNWDSIFGSIKIRRTPSRRPEFKNVFIVDSVN